MKIINAKYEILTDEIFPKKHILKDIERIARVCYKSEGKICKDSSSKLVQKLITSGHESMLEHSLLSVLFTVDRGISHELVRHRLASFAQESTRYCDYSDNRFDGELTFIKPYYLDEMKVENYRVWHETMQTCENAYLNLIRLGCSPQEARAVLPSSTKTEIVVSANYREWRHIFELRCACNAHPQMKEIMRPLLKEVKTRIPIIFDDVFSWPMGPSDPPGPKGQIGLCPNCQSTLIEYDKTSDTNKCSSCDWTDANA